MGPNKRASMSGMPGVAVNCANEVSHLLRRLELYSSLPLTAGEDSALVQYLISANSASISNCKEFIRQNLKGSELAEVSENMK